MIFKFPKNDKNYKWTQHIKDKMLFYRISDQKIKTILKNPDRREEGIAPNTLAMMKRNDTLKRKEEVWVMLANVQPVTRNTKRKNKGYKLHGAGSRLIMISTWRYPGKSKAGKEIPIPDDVLAEIKKEWF